MEKNQAGLSGYLDAIRTVLTTRSSEELQKGLGELYTACFTQTVETVRELSRRLLEINKAYLMEYVSAILHEDKGSREEMIALEDLEQTPIPAQPGPVFSDEARKLYDAVMDVTTLRQYEARRPYLLSGLRKLRKEEAEALSALLAGFLADMLIDQVLGDTPLTDPVMVRQFELWQKLADAVEWQQAQVALYFLTIEKDQLCLLLPCSFYEGAPAKAYYSCANILKVLSCQQDVWEYSNLLRVLYEDVEAEVLRRLELGMAGPDTAALQELFALLHAAYVGGNLTVWEYPRFELNWKKLERK